MTWEIMVRCDKCGRLARGLGRKWEVDGDPAVDMVGHYCPACARKRARMKERRRQALLRELRTRLSKEKRTGR